MYSAMKIVLSHVSQLDKANYTNFRTKSIHPLSPINPAVIHLLYSGF